MQTYDFVFSLHLVKNVLEITNESTTTNEEVYNFCMKYSIDVLDMNHMYCPQGKSQSRCKAPKLRNFH